MTNIYRSRTNRRITGLFGGLAEAFGIEATWLRLIAVVTVFFSGGILIPLYFIATLVIPSEPWHGGPQGPGYGFGGAGGCGRGRSFGPQFGQQYGSWKDWKRAERHYRKAQKYGWTPPHHEHAEYEAEYAHHHQAGAREENSSHLDDLMKDIEKKAMWKEIEELRAKVKHYEQQQQSTKGEV
ncbi:PspC domain-containing protein [Paenibacillus cremeus]|uniref:PspC domain-containing protein n=1 Tax=Paenibacillus cremeus TaxID=2163881 RepID=A0A559K0D0_9BACL|nr:PspC domain-containing protein [Paenibacillus cremeus]TVY05547.1 PspC domain-containing protein [Paenibacillus cremeus]